MERLRQIEHERQVGGRHGIAVIFCHAYRGQDQRRQIESKTRHSNDSCWPILRPVWPSMKSRSASPIS